MGQQAINTLGAGVGRLSRATPSAQGNTTQQGLVGTSSAKEHKKCVCSQSVARKARKGGAWSAGCARIRGIRFNRLEFKPQEAGARAPTAAGVTRDTCAAPVDRPFPVCLVQGQARWGERSWRNRRRQHVSFQPATTRHRERGDGAICPAVRAQVLHVGAATIFYAR